MTNFSHLVVTWLCCRRAHPEVQVGPAPHTLITTANAAGLIARIWPPQQGDVAWPPSLALDWRAFQRWSSLFKYAGPEHPLHAW